MPLRLGIILKKSFEWDTSKTEKEIHSESRSTVISEELNLEPCSKTSVKSVLKEFNYDADFSANIIIDGFFAYRAKGRRWGWKGKIHIWDVATPIFYNANSLKANRKYLVGVALLSGALLL